MSDNQHITLVRSAMAVHYQYRKGSLLNQLRLSKRNGCFFGQTPNFPGVYTLPPIKRLMRYLILNLIKQVKP
jgi:ribosomal protein L30/L7E